MGKLYSTHKLCSHLVTTLSMYLIKNLLLWKLISLDYWVGKSYPTYKINTQLVIKSKFRSNLIYASNLIKKLLLQKPLRLQRKYMLCKPISNFATKWSFAPKLKIHILQMVLVCDRKCLTTNKICNNFVTKRARLSSQI